MPYKIPGARNKFEAAVQQAGYPWVQTVRLNPGGYTDPPSHPFIIYDRLDTHQHQHKNTHLIIRGEMTLQREDGKLITLSADTPTMRDKEFTVRGGKPYQGMAGPEGAIFVEGHALLSPGTADRYERHGVIVWEGGDSNAEKEEWFRREYEARARDFETSTRPVDKSVYHQTSM